MEPWTTGSGIFEGRASLWLYAILSAGGPVVGKEEGEVRVVDFEAAQPGLGGLQQGGGLHAVGRPDGVLELVRSQPK